MPQSFDAVKNESLKLEWTDRLVQTKLEPAELARFAGRIGRVVTINCNGKAIVDFADGAWYDLPLVHLIPIEASTAQSKYDPTVNSAQPLPTRQG